MGPVPRPPWKPSFAGRKRRPLPPAGETLLSLGSHPRETWPALSRHFRATFARLRPHSRKTWSHPAQDEFDPAQDASQVCAGFPSSCAGPFPSDARLRPSLRRVSHHPAQDENRPAQDPGQVTRGLAQACAGSPPPCAGWERSLRRTAPALGLTPARGPSPEEVALTSAYRICQALPKASPSRDTSGAASRVPRVRPALLASRMGNLGWAGCPTRQAPARCWCSQARAPAPTRRADGRQGRPAQPRAWRQENGDAGERTPDHLCLGRAGVTSSSLDRWRSCA